jgi:hypothetical protein
MRQTFGKEDHDTDFVSWLTAHPDGFVLNHDHQPSRSYLVLHRASCYHWKDNRRWLASYSKTCADSIDELKEWAARSTGSSELQTCTHCSPF